MKIVLPVDENNGETPVCPSFQVRISILKALHEVIENLCGKLTVLALCGHIFFVSHLKYNLIKELLLFARPNFFVVIINAAVGAFLFGVIS